MPLPALRSKAMPAAPLIEPETAVKVLVPVLSMLMPSVLLLLELTASNSRV
ncbi:hypothetical protein D3C83_304200 [compost metagenome]